ncbi:FRG domain-containing protein [Deinococcus sp. UYEF24]
MEIFDIIIDNVDDLIKKLLSYDSGHVFRGQIMSSWRLKNGIERLFPENLDLPNISRLRQFEDRMMRKFKANAHLYEDIDQLPESNSRLGWLSLMQHYGAPTRLMDFTTMPFMALYFAIDGAPNYSKDFSSIYCVSFRDINELSVIDFSEKANKELSGVKNLLSSDRDVFYSTHVETGTYNLLWCMEPLKMNLRLMQQGGTFIFSDNISLKFEDALKNNSIYKNIPIDRIIFPHTLVSDIFILLTKMGITNKQIYPGLDGLSKDIKQEMVHYISRGLNQNSN